MAYTIKHMGLGGILDQAIAIIRDHFLLLLSIMAILVLPLLIVQGALALAVTPPLPPHPTMQDMMQAQHAQAQYWPWFLGIALIELIIFMPIANAAAIYAVSRLYLGLPITATEAIAYGSRRLLPLIGTTFLMYMAIWAGFIMCIIPGLYFTVWFGLSQHVVVLEGIAGSTALKRSKQLVHKDRGTFLALVLVLTGISFLVNISTHYIPQPTLRVVLAAVIQTLVMILWAASLVVFYFSCRSHVENFDLHYLAESIGVEPTEGGQFPSTATT